jgi:hypothetical protein
MDALNDHRIRFAANVSTARAPGMGLFSVSWFIRRCALKRLRRRQARGPQ